MYITVNFAKKHLNIDKEFTDDDLYIAALIEVAEAAVEKHLDSPLASLEDGDGYLPSPVAHAILLLVGNFYANRESVAFASAQSVPNSYEYLIDLYRNYRGRNLTEEAELQAQIDANMRHENNKYQHHQHYDQKSGITKPSDKRTITPKH